MRFNWVTGGGEVGGGGGIILTAAMLEAEVRESPHVTQTHTVADTGQQKLHRAAPLGSRLASRVHFLVEKKQTNNQMLNQLLVHNEFCVTIVQVEEIQRA